MDTDSPSASGSRNRIPFQQSVQLLFLPLVLLLQRLRFSCSAAGNSRVVLRLPRRGPNEETILVGFHWNRDYSGICFPYYTAHGSGTMCSGSLGRRLTLAMVPDLHSLHGTRPLPAVPTLH